MNIVEFILVAAWIIWFVFYFHLAWSKGSTNGPSFSKLLFPVFLFIEKSWPPGTEMQRIKLQISMLILVLATGLGELVGASSAT